MVKAVIFDFFGVLAGRTLGRFVNDYLAHDPQKLEQARKLRREGDLGLLSRSELAEALAKLAGVPVAKLDEYQLKLHINQEIIDYIRSDLKPKYKVSILSNAAGDYAHEILKPDDRQLFDDILVSYKFGLAKPDSKIYELAAKRLGVEPQECIFIDDKEMSADSAQKTGMKGIWYRNFTQMKADLEGLLAADGLLAGSD